MRVLLLLPIFLMSFLSIYAQSADCKLEGELKNESSTGYAYLINLSNKSCQVTPIVLGKFSFVVKKKKEFELGYIFIASDSLKRYDFFMENKKDLDSRSIAIEDAKMIVNTTLREAVVSGTKFNKELDEMDKAVVERNYSSFFDKYPDSPISLLLLKTLVRLSKIEMLNIKYDFKLFFLKLSKRLQDSEEGKAFLIQITPSKT